MKYGDIIAECNPMQNHWEVNEVLCYLDRIDIKTVVEIGIYQGGALAGWSRGLEPEHVIGVSLHEVELAPDFAQKAAPDGRPKVDLIWGRSQEQSVYDLLVATLAGRPIDFLFIDGGHSIEEVRSDFTMYSPLVRNGGVVGIHDVNRGAVDVYHFWEYTIRQNFRSVLVADALFGSAGIGISLITMGESPDGAHWIGT